MVNIHSMPHPSPTNHLNSDQSKKDIAFNLAMITLLIVILGISLMYLIDINSKKPDPTPSLTNQGEIIIKIIGGKKLAVPSNWFRFTDQLESEFADRVDLSFSLNLGENGKPILVNVTLQPIRAVKSSSVLLDEVYLHKFSDSQLTGPIGLIGKKLNQTKGYKDETIWYDAISSRPFVAKCIAPIASQKQQNCIRTVTLSPHISATYMFDFEVLKNWKIFDQQANIWLRNISGI